MQQTQEQQFAAALASLTPAQRAAYLAKNPAMNPYQGNAYVGANTQSGSITNDTIAGLDKQVKDLIKADPDLAHLTTANTVDDITNAYITHDFSGIRNITGQPFSEADQQAAFAKAQADLEPYYKAQKEYETKQTESALAQKQADYQNYLLTSGQNFQQDRANLNQSAVNRGVLFSGANAQKQRKLQSSYEQDQASKLGNIGRDIASTAQDYQYKYGNEAAQGLSKYYNLGGNTYGLGTAGGTVGSKGLSSVYSPSSSNYQGTSVNTATAEAQKRAAGYLWNKGNKLLSTGYQNKY